MIQRSLPTSAIGFVWLGNDNNCGGTASLRAAGVGIREPRALILVLTTACVEGSFGKGVLHLYWTWQYQPSWILSHDLPNHYVLWIN